MNAKKIEISIFCVIILATGCVAYYGYLGWLDVYFGLKQPELIIVGAYEIEIDKSLCIFQGFSIVTLGIIVAGVLYFKYYNS